MSANNLQFPEKTPLHAVQRYKFEFMIPKEYFFRTAHHTSTAAGWPGCAKTTYPHFAPFFPGLGARGCGAAACDRLPLRLGTAGANQRDAMSDGTRRSLTGEAERRSGYVNKADRRSVREGNRDLVFLLSGNTDLCFPPVKPFTPPQLVITP